MSDHVHLHEERPALHPRRLPPRNSGRATLIHLREGTLRPDPDGPVMAAPAYLYWPPGGAGGMTLGAGTRALVLEPDDALRADAIGARAESFDLRVLTDRAFAVALPDPQTAARAEALMGWFASEAAAAGPGSPMLLAAILRLVLIEALLLHRPHGAPATEETRLLRHFRHLVEAHHTDHWQIADYARALDVTYDRLHRICRAELDRSPAELVNQRLTAAAQERLSRSGAPLKAVAADLGFPDASRFGHFFKRRTGLSPGAWRAAAARRDAGPAPERAGFADWP